MMKIILANRNTNSLYKSATLDLTQNSVLLNQQGQIPLHELKQLDFHHPLLSEPSLELQNETYTYIYDNLAELLLAPRRIYATLLNNLENKQYHFKITPTSSFLQLKTNYAIPFSLSSHKQAKETINVVQLNKIVSALKQNKFQLLDKLILNAHFSYQELPAEINGDDLYCQNEIMSQLLDNEEHFEKYELRYINHFIGLGLFTRQEIKKNEWVSLYLGTKTSEPEDKSYFYHNKKDSLSMGTDSKMYGNMSRFINHAPTTDHPTSNFCDANLSSPILNLFGIEVVAFKASRDIKKGEQLLVDYGSQYFNFPILRFKLDGELVDTKGNIIRDNLTQKMSVLRLCAQNAVREAKFKVIKRYVLMITFISLLFIALNYL